MYPYFLTPNPDIHQPSQTATQASDYNPRHILDLTDEAKKIRGNIYALQRLWYDAITRRIYGHYPFRNHDGTERLASDILREIEIETEKLDLIISEIDRRRI